MPQYRKPARLYFKKSRGWIIIDGTTQRGTGFRREQLREAEKALADYTEANHRIDTRKRNLSEIWCEDVINLYTTDAAPSKPSAATIGYHGTNLLLFWGDKNLSDVKRSNCKKYVEFRMKKALPTKKDRPQRFVSAATARQELKTFGAAINYWHGESPLEAVPRVSLPDVVSKRERVLERNEVAKLLRAARKLKYAHVIRFILIGLYTGTRHDAILKLRWDASLSAGHIDVEKGIIFRRGSAERESSKRRPPVRIFQRLGGRVARWQKMDHEKFSSVIHYNGVAVLKMKRAWATVVKEAKLGPEVTPHVLRHTCATWLLREGKTTWDVAGIIGADSSTVERVYGHHRIDTEVRKSA